MIFQTEKSTKIINDNKDLIFFDLEVKYGACFLEEFFTELFFMNRLSLKIEVMHHKTALENIN